MYSMTPKMTYLFLIMHTLAYILCVLIRNPEKIDAKSVIPMHFVILTHFFAYKMYPMTPKMTYFFQVESTNRTFRALD
jgi:hypothetical protein